MRKMKKCMAFLVALTLCLIGSVTAMADAEINGTNTNWGIDGYCWLTGSSKADGGVDTLSEVKINDDHAYFYVVVKLSINGELYGTEAKTSERGLTSYHWKKPVQITVVDRPDYAKVEHNIQGGDKYIRQWVVSETELPH